jgi:tRNA(Arg) A34 adenosine deaminase TadA
MMVHCCTALPSSPTVSLLTAAAAPAAAALYFIHCRGCVLYTSSEPCPMCMGACYWARIDKVFYATTAKDVKVCVCVQLRQLIC